MEKARQLLSLRGDPKNFSHCTLQVPNHCRERRDDDDFWPADVKTIPTASKQMPTTLRQRPITSRKFPITSRQMPNTSRKIQITSRKIPITSRKIPITSRQLADTTRRKGFDTVFHPGSIAASRITFRQHQQVGEHMDAISDKTKPAKTTDPGKGPDPDKGSDPMPPPVASKGVRATPDETKLAGLIRGIKKLGLSEHLPDEIALPLLESLLAESKTATATDVHALVDRKDKVNRVNQAEDALASTTSRFERLLNSLKPQGTPGRSDFFPAGPGPHDEVARGKAILLGMTKHQLPTKSIAPDLRREAIESLVHEVVAGREARAEARTTKKETSPARKDVRLQIKTLTRRASEFVHSWYTSEVDLAAFGLKPRGRR